MYLYVRNYLHISIHWNKVLFDHHNMTKIEQYRMKSLSIMRKLQIIDDIDNNNDGVKKIITDFHKR